MGLTCIYKHWLSCIVKLIWEMTPRWQENFHICLYAAMGWMQRWTKHWSSKLRVIQKKLGMDKGTLRVLQVLTIKFWVKGTKATEVDIGFLWTSSSSGQMLKAVWVSGWITRSGPNKLHSMKVTISLQTTTKMYVGSLNQLYVIINWATLCKPLNPCHLFPWGKIRGLRSMNFQVCFNSECLSLWGGYKNCLFCETGRSRCQCYWEHL